MATPVYTREKVVRTPTELFFILHDLFTTPTYTMHLNDRYPKVGLREYPDYVPRSTVGLTLSTAAYSFAAGVFASAVKNSLQKPKGAGYLHPKTGLYVYLFSKSCN